MEKSVEIRNAMKKRKPSFIKQMGRQKIRLKNKWRRPRGSDSKIKIGKKDYPKKIKIGYKGPKSARTLSRQGLKIVVVESISGLSNIDKAKEIVCIANVGKKKKIDIVKKCVELSLQISNLKDAAKFLKETEEKISKKKEEKQKKEEEKKKKVAEKEKKAEKPKEGIEGKVDDKKDEESKDTEKKEKKEKDKLLTKRDV